jgi:hypothetical protein
VSKRPYAIEQRLVGVALQILSAKILNGYGRVSWISAGNHEPEHPHQELV